MVVIKTYSSDANGNIVADWRGESSESTPAEALPGSSIYFTDTYVIKVKLKDGTWQTQGE